MKAEIQFGDDGCLVLAVEGESASEWTMLKVHGAQFGLVESKYGDWRIADSGQRVTEPAK